MKLIQLSIRNFKNLKGLTFQPEGYDAVLYGDNATGKTAVYDAFMWALFGKDSQNKSDFEIKTLKPDGTPIHHLEHSVEVHLQLEDGELLILKKTLREKWSKKRGYASASFTGHTTEHFVDGVPVPAKLYHQRIAGLMDEDLFRLLTSPHYFNLQLHWQKRREILLNLCGDLTDAEVIRSNEELKPLAAILDRRSIEDHRKVLAARKKEINRELERIPVRIDEVNRSLAVTISDGEGGMETEAEQMLEGLESCPMCHQPLPPDQANKVREKARLAHMQEREMRLEEARVSRKRISQLEADEKRLSEEYVALENILFLTEVFVREKVSMLESRINSKFKMARFKLFHRQQNGGLAETCETMVDGIPFGSLNNAARINAGLDILNTLSQHYGRKAPVFVDNAEAITSLIEIDSQTIRLIVSASHPKLTMGTGEGYSSEEYSGGEVAWPKAM